MGNSLSLQNGNDPGVVGNAGIGGSSSGGINSIPNSRFNLLYSHFHFSSIQKRKKPAHQQTVSFSSHFIIAGRRFKNLINQTQNFLFGDQLDLNFIMAHKPVAVRKKHSYHQLFRLLIKRYSFRSSFRMEHR